MVFWVSIAVTFVTAMLGSPSWTRTNDTAVNSRVLYRLSYGGISKGSGLVRPDPSLCWRYLSSRAVSSQVLWAQMSLTAVFGMGTGGPSPQSTPTILIIAHATTKININFSNPCLSQHEAGKQMVTRTGIEPMFAA